MTSNSRNSFLPETTILLATAVMLALSGCGGPDKPAVQAAQQSAGNLPLWAVRTQQVPNVVEAPGSVAAGRTARIAARVMGTVLRVPVQEGDTVKTGQLLAEIDEREIAQHRLAARAAVDEASAAREEASHAIALATSQAEIAQKTLDRYQMLREKKAVAPQEFDEVSSKQRASAAAVEAAKARLRQAEAAYTRAQSETNAAETVATYTKIAAPFDGVITRRAADPGAMAVPGQPLIVVEDTRYRFEAALPASAAAGVARGMKIPLLLDAFPNQAIDGTVTEFSPSADPESQTVIVKIALPVLHGVRSGLFGRARFARGEREAIVIPGKAILERGQIQGVYVIDASQTAQWRVIATSAASPLAGPGKSVEVLSGLSDGERIVLDPAGRSLDGMKVEARP